MWLTPFGFIKLERGFPWSSDQTRMDLSDEQEIKYLESKENSQSQTHFLWPTNRVLSMKSLLSLLIRSHTRISVSAEQVASKL